MDTKYQQVAYLIDLSRALLNDAYDILLDKPVDVEERLSGHTPDDLACHGAYAPCRSQECAEFGLCDCPDMPEEA